MNKWNSAGDFEMFRFARADDFPQFEHLDRQVLKPADIIPWQVFFEWFGANPNVFRVMEHDGRVVGYYSILPLRDHAMKAVVDGAVVESELTAADISDPEQARAARTVYFFSIVRDPSVRGLGRLLRRDAWDYLLSCRDYPAIECMYATAATDKGRKLLESMGFQLVMPAEARRDGHALYRISSVPDERP